jgi:hypothetical protein
MADPTVTLNGITLHPPNADGTGYEIDETGLVGWYGTPKTKASYTPRPANAGSYFSPLAYADIRLIGITGTMVQATSSAFLLAQRALDAICPDPSQLYTFQVTDDAGTLTAQVQRSDAVLFTPQSSLSAAFTLALTAPDPFRYDPNLNTASTLLPVAASGLDWSTGGGLDWSTGGGLNWGSGGSDGTCTILNSGPAPASPIFTIAGPTDSGTLSNIQVVDSATGQIIAFSGTLNLNDVLVIDTRSASRSALLNGNDAWTSLSISQWFTVPGATLGGITVPGQLKTQFVGTSTSTTPLLTVTAASTYF